jgi:hypothetical protein
MTDFAGPTIAELTFVNRYIGRTGAIASEISTVATAAAQPFPDTVLPWQLEAKVVQLLPELRKPHVDEDATSAGSKVWAPMDAGQTVGGSSRKRVAGEVDDGSTSRGGERQ